MGKGLLVIILGTVMTLAIVSMNLLQTANSGMDNALEYYEDVQARNLGNSMVNFLLTRIADSAAYRAVDGEEVSYLGGDLEYRVLDTALVEGDTLIKIEVTVDFNGYPKTITSYSWPPIAAGWVPEPIRGAWTAKGDLNNTISDMYIDGRDHDLNLNIIPGEGGAAISCSVEFINVDNAAIAGTYNGIDYVLSNPEDPDVIEEFYSWGTEWPRTPDEILGYPDGTLKELAKEGAGGSQYIKDPALPGGKAQIDSTHLSFPLTGVTFVELTDGIERNLLMFGAGNQGILIVHGPNTSSRLKGLKILPWSKAAKAPKRADGDPWDICHFPGEPDQADSTVADADLESHLNHGDMLNFCPDMDSTWFKGLIVTDFSFHHHLDILGAMIQLSENLETDKNCNGNKDHWVKYSSAAIEEATGFAAEESGLMGNSTEVKYNDVGFGIGRQKSNYWFE